MKLFKKKTADGQSEDGLINTIKSQPKVYGVFNTTTDEAIRGSLESADQRMGRDNFYHARQVIGKDSWVSNNQLYTYGLKGYASPEIKNWQIAALLLTVASAIALTLIVLL